MLNIRSIKILRGTDVEININKYNITPGFQRVFTDKSYNTIKSMNDMDKVVLRDILRKTNCYKRIPYQVVIQILKTIWLMM